ncbi:MAG: DEAD/DEAH box helicase [Chloroflexi bacterium]|nr:DEAD/DEAH box helicase [Chloroflexota bacterium]
MKIGIVKWYDEEKACGVLQDVRGVTYFVRARNIVEPRGGPLEEGEHVHFGTQQNERRLDEEEAIDVHLVEDEAPRKSSARQDALHAAAGRVLQHKQRLLREGLPQPIDPFAKGARITHPEHGLGTVLISTRRSITLEFDDGMLQSFEREVLQVLLADASSSRITGRSTQFSKHMNALRSDAFEDLTEEGIAVDRIYRVEDDADAAPLETLPELDERVRTAFDAVGIRSFYSHQAQAYRALRDKKSVVLSTPTASGKTASFTPAILEELLTKRGSTALFVFPLVALATDQVERLRELNEHLPESDRLTIGVLNSSVSAEEKQQVRARDNDIIITTPDSLHYLLLSNAYANWARFFRNLRFVVLDEAHVYKGAFGSNVANIVRRVAARTFRLSNRAPQVVISSATVHSPLHLATQLTGFKPEHFTVIDRSGARVPRRHFLMTRTPAQDLCEFFSDAKTDDSNGSERPVSMIVFTRSINAAKSGSSRLREFFRKQGRGYLGDAVADYYSDRADKNDVFARLRRGEIRFIFSTTALMAGIDIGDLDVAIVDGFPGQVMDARQMFGRAGRRGEGAAIFVAHAGSPFDDFYLRNPDLLFHGPTEPVIANPENPILLSAHLLCAAHTGDQMWRREGPLMANALRLFGGAAAEVVDELEGRGLLRIAPDGAIHGMDGHPHDEWPLNDLRATNEREPFQLIDENGRELEKKRRALAFRDAHPDALFMHDGTCYRITRFPKRGEKATVIECKVVRNDGIWTRGDEEIGVKVRREILPVRDVAQFRMSGGEVTVRTEVLTYHYVRSSTLMRCTNRRCRHESPNTLLSKCAKCKAPMREVHVESVEAEKHPISEEYDLSFSLDTQAAWIELPAKLREEFAARFWPRWRSDVNDNVQPYPDYECAMNSALNAVLKAFPQCANCDIDDIAAVAVGERWYFYDNFPGGLGLAVEFARDPQPYLETALEYVERCICDDTGCPVCLHNFRMRSSDVLSRLATRYLLRRILGSDAGQVILDLEVHVDTFHAAEKMMRPTTGRRSLTTEE